MKINYIKLFMLHSLLIGSVFSVTELVTIPRYYLELANDFDATYQEYVTHLQKFGNHVPEIAQDGFSHKISEKGFPLYTIHFLEDMKLSDDASVQTFERMAKNRMIATILGDKPYPIRRQIVVDSHGFARIGEAYPFA